MKYEQWIKLSRNVLKDEVSAKLLVQRNVKKQLRKFIGNSQRGFPCMVQFFDSHGTDFIMNIIRVRVEFDVYKIPRFLKQYLLKKK